MTTTDAYGGIGEEYRRARKGTTEFANFMMDQCGLQGRNPNLALTIIELGIGSGQQTEFVEKELSARGFNNYRILGYDKSCTLAAGLKLAQLNVVIERLRAGEISPRVIPINYDFDGVELPLKPQTADLTYMAFVFHQLTHKQSVLTDIARVTRPSGRHFMFGASIEDLENHPLNEFFPMKFQVDRRRYPTRKELQQMFNAAGFSYEEPCRIKRDKEKPIDRAFLRSIENTTINSALRLIRDNAPEAFRQGVERVRKEVEQAEGTGEYKTFSIERTVFWGIRYC